MEAIPYPQELKANGICLRAVAEQDYQAIVSWGRDEEITRWTGVPKNNSMDIVLARRQSVEQERLAGKSITLAIVDEETDSILGNCDIRRPDMQDPGFGEIGYLIGENARGRGVASSALILMLSWAMPEMKLGRVQALVHPDNLASQKVLLKIGFEREGLLRAYRSGSGDERQDRTMYSLLPYQLVALALAAARFLRKAIRLCWSIRPPRSIC